MQVPSTAGLINLEDNRTDSRPGQSQLSGHRILQGQMENLQHWKDFQRGASLSMKPVYPRLTKLEALCQDSAALYIMEMQAQCCMMAYGACSLIIETSQQ